MADDVYVVERSVAIAAPVERVFGQIDDFHRWVAWSPWEGRDPELDRTYSGSGVGAVYRWSGNRRAGSGQMTITEAARPSRVGIALQFEKPFRSSSEVVFTLRPEGDGCTVTWSMYGPRTLMTRVMGLVRSMDAFLGPDFEKGLARLKATAELPVGQ